jgi:hypothetical protein
MPLIATIKAATFTFDSGSNALFVPFDNLQHFRFCHVLGTSTWASIVTSSVYRVIQ